MALNVGRDSSVGIATCCGLDCQGSNPGGELDFPYPSRPTLGTTQSPIQWVTGLSNGIKQPERGFNHTSKSSIEVKDNVELYLYFRFEISWLFLGRNLPLPFTLR